MKHFSIFWECRFSFSGPLRDPSFCISNAAVHATSFEGQVSREPTQVLIAPHLTISSAQWTPIYYAVLESWWSETAMRKKKMNLLVLCIPFAQKSKNRSYWGVTRIDLWTSDLLKAITYILLEFTEIPPQNINYIFICKVTDCHFVAKLLTKPHTKFKVWLDFFCDVTIFKK